MFHLPWSCAAGAATCVGGSGALCDGGMPGCAQRQRYKTCFSATSDALLFGASFVNCTTPDCASGNLGACTACPRVCACAELSAAAPGGPGLYDTDFALYVTASDEPYCAGGSVLAMGAPCELDVWSGRPLSGNANFCPSALRTAAATDGSSNAWGMQLDTALHEITHALGFSSRLFSRFVAEDGASPLQPSAVTSLPDWVVRVRARSFCATRAFLTAPPAQNDTASFMVSPLVRAEAAGHFGDETLPGIALENSGMAGTRSSHWEQRWLNGEAMVGVKLARSPYSRFTQAALTDSGWYAPTGGQLAQPGGLRWGAAAGGAFVMDSCLARPLSAALLAKGWCDAAVSAVQDCTLDKRAVAFCGSDSYLEVRRTLARICAHM